MARQIVNLRESPLKIQLPRVERGAVYPTTVENQTVHPLESTTENQISTRTTKQIQQTGNFDIRLNPNDVRRRTQAQQRHATKGWSIYFLSRTIFNLTR